MDRTWAGWCGCALVVLLAAGRAAGGEPSAAGVLLLRNGHVLSGQVLRIGDYYSVELAGGSMRIPASQVDLACRDLAEAYRTKLAAAQAGSPQERLDLAEWCLRQGMNAEAAEQVLAAGRLDPGNPRLAPLERKLLAAASELAAHASPSAAPAKPAPVEKPASEEAEIAISPAALSDFTNGIQPLLLNRCGTTTCHGGASGGGFKLTRSPFGPLATQRVTRRNLAAVMAMVDRDSPEKSRLLTVPKAAHGTAQGPIFSDRDLHQWQAVSNWIAIASRPPAAAPARPVRPPPDEVDSPFTVAAKPLFLAGTGREPSGTVEPRGGEPARAAVSPPLPLGGDAPRDPFDPEIFHRLTAEPAKKDG